MSHCATLLLIHSNNAVTLTIKVDMETQKQVAEVFRIALLCSCCEREEVTDWADNLISDSSDPDYDLIEISTSASWQILDLMNNLSQMSIGSNDYSALRIVLGRMYEIASKDKTKLSVFASGLYQIAIENQYDFPDDLLFCNGIEDEYQLASLGYLPRSFAEVEADFLRSLLPYWTSQHSTSSWYASEPVIAHCI
jgi:hypothetical protein